MKRWMLLAVLLLAVGFATPLVFDDRKPVPTQVAPPVSERDENENPPRPEEPLLDFILALFDWIGRMLKGKP